MPATDWWKKVKQYRESLEAVSQAAFAEMLNDTGTGLALSQKTMSVIESGGKKKLDLNFAEAFRRISGINLVETFAQGNETAHLHLSSDKLVPQLLEQVKLLTDLLKKETARCEKLEAEVAALQAKLKERG
jgi:hypothetical protein